MEKISGGKWPTFGQFSICKMWNIRMNCIKHIKYIGIFALYTSNMRWVKSGNDCTKPGVHYFSTGSGFSFCLVTKFWPSFFLHSSYLLFLFHSFLNRLLQKRMINCSVYNLIILSLRKKNVRRRKRKDSLSRSRLKANRVTNDERTQSRVWERHSPTSIWPKAQKTRKRIFVTQVDTCSLYFRALYSP